MDQDSLPEFYRGCEGTIRYMLDLLYDYDGCTSVDTLKDLIDEVVLIGKEYLEENRK